MSLILEEEKKKLAHIEDEEYKLAIAVSKSLANEEEEISLFDPSTLVKKGNDDPSTKKSISRPQKQDQQSHSLINYNNINIQQTQSNNINSQAQQGNTSDPVVTTHKKDFDFSHFNNNKEIEKKNELIPNNLIEKTEKITFVENNNNNINNIVATQANNNPDLISFEEPKKSDPIIEKDPILEAIIVNNIPIVKKDKSNIIKENKDTNIKDTRLFENTMIGQMPIEKKEGKLPENISHRKYMAESVLSRGGEAISTVPVTQTVPATQTVNLERNQNQATIGVEHEVNSKSFFDTGKKASLLDFTKQTQPSTQKMNLGEIKTKKNAPINKSDANAFLDQQFNYKPEKKSYVTDRNH